MYSFGHVSVRLLFLVVKSDVMKENKNTITDFGKKSFLCLSNQQQESVNVKYNIIMQDNDIFFSIIGSHTIRQFANF